MREIGEKKRRIGGTSCGEEARSVINLKYREEEQGQPNFVTFRKRVNSLGFDFIFKNETTESRSGTDPRDGGTEYGWERAK